MKIRNEWCKKVSTQFSITITVIDVIEALLCILISLILIYKIWFYDKKRPFPCCIQLNQITFYIVSILYGICALFSALMSCTLTFNNDTIVLGLLCLLRAIQISLFELILGLRIVYVFDSTIYQIGQRNIILSTILWTVYLCAALMAATFFMIIDPNPQYLPFIASILLFCDLIINCILSLVFICKLYDVNKIKVCGLSSLSEQININTENNNNRMLNVITKYTVLSMISTISSLIWILINLSYALKLPLSSSHQAMFGILLVGPVLNSVSLIDIFSMSLSFKFTEKYYRICCKCCDDKCRKCCVRCTVRKKRTKPIAKTQRYLDLDLK
eukprot:333434_1